MSDKDTALQAIHQLPDDITLAAIRDELTLLAKIREGLADADAGRVVPHEQVEREFRTWISS